jgi:hypothetical protein
MATIVPKLCVLYALGEEMVLQLTMRYWLMLKKVVVGAYRVIHKFVKHFKNSQQIDYAMDHGNSYADRERNSPSFFYIFHRCSMCPPLVIQQTSM